MENAIDYEEYLVCQTLDAPVRILFWTADVFLLWIFAVALGFLLELLIPCLVTALIMTRVLSKLRTSGVSRQIRSAFYWYMPMVTMRAFPSSAIRLFVA